jgi:uncharacterized protein
MTTIDETRFFVCRLLAPRPTFPMDMTEQERGLMGEHSAYWSSHMAKGKVVIFGPVLDPKNVWGLAVLRVKDAAEVQSLTAADPIIVANRGFSYEVLPMMSAVVPT